MSIPQGTLPETAKGAPDTSVKLPLPASVKSVTVLLAWLLTKSNCWFGLSRTTFELLPTPGKLKGELAVGANTPLDAMLKTLTKVPPVTSLKRPPKRRLLAVLMSIPATPQAPTEHPAGSGAENGDPATGVSAPLAAMLKMAIVSEAGNATAKNWSLAETSVPSAINAPLGKGEPGTAVSAPPEPTLKAKNLRRSNVAGEQELAVGSHRQRDFAGSRGRKRRAPPPV